MGQGELHVAGTRRATPYLNAYAHEGGGRSGQETEAPLFL